jgi:predicted nucleotidyltransferase
MMDRLIDFPYLPKDFIETAEGLIFAVVSYGAQAGKVGCFLRYVRSASGWHKITTDAANTLLAENYAHYLHHCQQFDATFHAVEVKQIIRHYKPEQKMIDLILAPSRDVTVQRLQRLIPILVRYGADLKMLGVTGSLLIDRQTFKSDIDVVVYSRDAFHQVRSCLIRAVANGELSLLDDASMRENYQRRLGELVYEDFAWHENRKFNKAIIEGTKFDIGMVDFQIVEKQEKRYQKRGVLTLEAVVSDDQFSFDYPARYKISTKEVTEILVYTNTYVGQAKTGEKIEVSGAVECDIATGKCRLIVGSSREAVGEYIKVIKDNE